MSGFSHLPVMPDEVISFLAPRAGGIYLDGTVGGGGHTALIAERCMPQGLLIGIDQDLVALEAARLRLSGSGSAIKLFHGNFALLGQYTADLGIKQIDGFIFDLGVSSHQLDTVERGFSFQQDAPLDMRMDRSRGKTASDMVNSLPEKELERILREFGEERWAKRIAAFIVKARTESPIERTLQLVDIIKGAVPKAMWDERIHPATRTFQGIRIAVNSELEMLEQGLKVAIDLLKPGGRGVVISFHSLEDRIVKQTFRDHARGCICPRQLPVCVCGNQPLVRILTSHPVTAATEELAQNPRSRSAKLRAIEKLLT